MDVVLSLSLSIYIYIYSLSHINDTTQSLQTTMVFFPT